ncbi:hypothetical protein PLICRDRAFT_179896 [Plicaturopsis crispa FD-325 SS-3]|uniref:Uncharacterized protein n=1 Tax=Plicaturopsis crispa FD-325 SS-3 TaxID=944288 RepID=A0A0C9T7Y0_PLICR|nr:hypothetical protein PLICRDRAFT_179896 [Plicaturopsis crispa FD-325 SS-3]
MKMGMPHRLRMLAKAYASQDSTPVKPANDYTKEVNIMAELGAYFDLSSRRIIEKVSDCVDLFFVRAVTDCFSKNLCAHLEIGATREDARYKGFLRTGTLAVAQREKLISREKLLEALRMDLLRPQFN